MGWFCSEWYEQLVSKETSDMWTHTSPLLRYDWRYSSRWILADKHDTTLVPRPGGLDYSIVLSVPTKSMVVDAVHMVLTRWPFSLSSPIASISLATRVVTYLYRYFGSMVSWANVTSSGILTSETMLHCTAHVPFLTALLILGCKVTPLSLLVSSSENVSP